MRRRIALAIALALGATSVACSVPKEAGFPDVARAVEQRTGHRAYWNRGGEADREVEHAVHDMLAHELSPAEAVQIGLLENASLQATYEELSIAQADLVQAGMLKNPTLRGFFHFPLAGTKEAHWEFGVEQDFLDLLTLPGRKRIAAADFEAAKARVGGEVVRFAYDVREAYFTLVAAQQITALRRAILDGAEAAAALAGRQREAGTMNELDLVQQLAVLDQARVDLATSQARVLAARERLARLLGLWGAELAFKVPARLPDLPSEEPALEHLEAHAVLQRLDLAAARRDLDARAEALALATSFRFLPGVSLGAAVDRDADGPTNLGPAASLELPIFDQKQAAIARLAADVRAADLRLRALAVAARSEVREVRDRVLHLRGLADYQRTTVIPHRERVVALTQTHYDAMLVGAYQLLQAKAAEVSAYAEYLETVRDYWIARSDLGRAVGGRLPSTGGNAQ